MKRMNERLVAERSSCPQSAPDEAARSRRARLMARRRGWLMAHRYLGLFLGAVLSVVGLTGSGLAFWQEIDAWLNPEMAKVEAPPAGTAAYRPLREILAAADAAMPPDAKSSYAYYPRGPDFAFWFFYDGPKDADDQFDTLNVFVNPYTAEVTGTRIWYHAHNPLKHCFVGFLFKLHYALLLGRTGAALVGFLGVFLLISVLSGLILWWPLTGKWRRALTIKPRAGKERLNYDLHKTFGFYLLPVLAALAISGVSFNLPEQFVWLVELFSPVGKQTPASIPDPPDRPAMDPELALQGVLNRFPDERPYWFAVPPSPSAPYALTLNAPAGHFFSGRHQLAVDRYTGEILEDKSPVAGSGGQIFMQWQWPLHSGYALGMTGRISVLLAGFACILLFVTGVVRWLQKRAAALPKKTGVRNPVSKPGVFERAQ